MAGSARSTGCEPKPKLKLKLKLKKTSISEDSDATPINDPDRDNFSDFSRVTSESTGRFGVSNVCIDPSLSHVSWDSGVLPEKNQLLETESSDPLFSHVSCVGENVLLGRHRLPETECRQREREDTENSGSVISVDESISRKSRRNITNDARSKISHSRLTQHELSSDERDVREHFERRARQTKKKVKFQLRRKLYSTQYDMEIKDLERKNSEYALFESQRELESQRQHLRQASQWADHAQREKNLLGELERKNRLHHECHARSCQEIEELKRRCYKQMLN